MDTIKQCKGLKLIYYKPEQLYRIWMKQTLKKTTPDKQTAIEKFDQLQQMYYPRQQYPELYGGRVNLRRAAPEGFNINTLFS